MPYEIHVTHKDSPEKTIETGQRYISAFEGSCGDGWVLSVDRETHEGTLISNDIDEPCEVDKNKPFGSLILDQAESLWLKSCWAAILQADLKVIDEIFDRARAR